MTVAIAATNLIVYNNSLRRQMSWIPRTVVVGATAAAIAATIGLDLALWLGGVIRRLAVRIVVARLLVPTVAIVHLHSSKRARIMRAKLAIIESGIVLELFGDCMLVGSLQIFVRLTCIVGAATIRSLY
jgi:hypothetical protein